jgi:hypothetical protein
MDSYDKTKIGKKIADGGDRKVYMYDADRVIKFSSLSFFVGKKLHTKYSNDYVTCKNYFGKYIVETTNASNANTGQYIEIQPFIQGEMLMKKHTENPAIQSQLKEIHQILHRMKNDNIPPIDLVGNVGMIKSCLSNIIIDPDGNLKIIDAVLLEGKTVRPMGLILDLFAPIVILRQNYLMRLFLK